MFTKRSLIDSKPMKHDPKAHAALHPWALRWLLVVIATCAITSALSTAILGWDLDSNKDLPMGRLQDNKSGLSSSSSSSSSLSTLTYHYQKRLNGLGWWNEQCGFLQSIIQVNQTVFPYLQVPPLSGEEDSEQFHLNPFMSSDHRVRNDAFETRRTRIAVLHLWASSNNQSSQAPPFFQYWLASAMANAPIADFLLFVPDNQTKELLQEYLPHSTSIGLGHNIRINVVGDLGTVFLKRIGSILAKAKYQVKGPTLSRLKPMLAYVFEEYLLAKADTSNRFGEEDYLYSHWPWGDMDMIRNSLRSCDPMYTRSTN